MPLNVVADLPNRLINVNDRTWIDEGTASSCVEQEASLFQPSICSTQNQELYLYNSAH